MALPSYIIEAQHMINSGMAWRMEGAYSRAAMAFIREGACMLGREGHKDYWGNYVPSRDEVLAGTKEGSRDFVAEYNGEEYADELVEIW